MIKITNARTNNLKNINLEIPKNCINVITGVSGSGKTSLAFDTIFVEGQRKYFELLSYSIKGNLPKYPKADVDTLTGLTPVCSLKKNSRVNSNSTVGTLSEIIHYLRLMFARIGSVYCPDHNLKLEPKSLTDIYNNLKKNYSNKEIKIIANLGKFNKENAIEICSKFKSKGYIFVLINGKSYDLDETLYLKDIEKSINKISLEIVVDDLKCSTSNKDRIIDSLENTSLINKGKIKVNLDKKNIFYSTSFACPQCEFTIQELSTKLFSPQNHPCLDCNNLGYVFEFDKNKLIINSELSIPNGGLLGFDARNKTFNESVKALCRIHKVDYFEKLKNIDSRIIDLIINGFEINGKVFRGIKSTLESFNESEETNKVIFKKYFTKKICSSCLGSNLGKLPLSVKISNKNFSYFSSLDISTLNNELQSILKANNNKLFDQILTPLINKLSNMVDIGIEYINLNRKIKTLSSGELQRLKIATQISNELTGITYIFDEPTTGLHPNNVKKIIKIFKKIKDYGNTLIIIEHDREMINAADNIINLGPSSGDNGGEICSPLTVKKNNFNLLVSNNNVLDFQIVNNIYNNNLKKISVKFPLNKITSITGVSGSGKSSLLSEIFSYYNERIDKKIFYKIKFIDRVLHKTSKLSTAGTYSGIFENIRFIFSQTSFAKKKGLSESRFSYNNKDSQCSNCKGQGFVELDMFFLSNIKATCKSCHGSRYAPELLEVKYKNKSINEILSLSFTDCLTFFRNHKKIINLCNLINCLGIGYLKIGQPISSLSGGEIQRLNLVKELSKDIEKNNKLYLIDEPTAGLHDHDINFLIELLMELKNKGNTILISEHNYRLFEVSDWFIELGPKSGPRGGNVIVQGNRKTIKDCKLSITKEFIG